MTSALRRLAPPDLAAIVALEARATSRPWSAAAVEEELQGEGREAWGIDEDGVLAGWIALRTVVDELWIFEVAVDPALRRRGLGRQLLGHAQDRAKALGLPLWLEVRARNAAALSLYTAAGFEEQGRRPRYYPPEEEGQAPDDAVLMRFCP